MRLVIVTKNGVPIERDVVREVLRRSRENGGDPEAALLELESELDAYAKELVKAPEWGEVAPKAE